MAICSSLSIRWKQTALKMLSFIFFYSFHLIILRLSYLLFLRRKETRGFSRSFLAQRRRRTTTRRATLVDLDALMIDLTNKRNLGHIPANIIDQSTAQVSLVSFHSPRHANRITFTGEILLISDANLLTPPHRVLPRRLFFCPFAKNETSIGTCMIVKRWRLIFVI